MINFPNGKINLGLSVLRKREDGYHDIESVFYPVGLQDALEIVDASDNKFRFSLSGLTIDGEHSENLCIRAFELLRKNYGISPVHMHLHKAIPIQAGLGGGSANGAFTIKLLNRHFKLYLSGEKMKELAAQLGSDCSFFILNQPALVNGRGEKFRQISFSLDKYYVVIVKPDAGISTVLAYSKIHPEANIQSLTDIVTKPIAEWKDKLINDFEKPVFEMLPQLAAIKSKLYKKGAIYAAMSGSGSAIYGIFDHEVDLKNEFEGCFVWNGKA